MSLIPIHRRGLLSGAAGLVAAPAAFARPREAIAANVLDTTADNQAATFRNQDLARPVRAIRRGARVRPLPPFWASHAS